MEADRGGGVSFMRKGEPGVSSEPPCPSSIWCHIPRLARWGSATTWSIERIAFLPIGVSADLRQRADHLIEQVGLGRWWIRSRETRRIRRERRLETGGGRWVG